METRKPSSDLLLYESIFVGRSWDPHSQWYSYSLKINQHKESITSLQSQLQQALQREKHLLQTMVSKEVYEDLSRKATACQDDLTRTLEKVRPHPVSFQGVCRPKGGWCENCKSQFLAWLPSSKASPTLSWAGRAVHKRPAFSQWDFLGTRLGKVGEVGGQIEQIFPNHMGDSGARFYLDHRGNSSLCWSCP